MALLVSLGALAIPGLGPFIAAGPILAALSLSLLALGAAPLAGCEAASCEKVCETQNGCSGATQVADCQASCDADRKAAEEAGCASEYDSRMSCLGTVSSCATSWRRRVR